MRQSSTQQPDNGLTVEWLDESRRILFYRISGQWTLNEFWTAIYTGRAMVADVDHDVYAIFLINGKLSIPPRFLATVGNLQRGYPDKIKMNVVVGMDGFIRTIYRILKPVIPRLLNTINFVDSLDVALATIEALSQDAIS